MHLLRIPTVVPIPPGVSPHALSAIILADATPFAHPTLLPGAGALPSKKKSGRTKYAAKAQNEKFAVWILDF